MGKISEVTSLFSKEIEVKRICTDEKLRVARNSDSNLF